MHLTAPIMTEIDGVYVTTYPDKNVQFQDTYRLTGQIPPEFGNLSRLVHFDLSCNYLTGSIPSEIGKLGYLKILNLSYNKLSGIVPSELGILSERALLDSMLYVKYLYISNSEVPESFIYGMQIDLTHNICLTEANNSGWTENQVCKFNSETIDEHATPSTIIDDYATPSTRINNELIIPENDVVIIIQNPKCTINCTDLEKEVIAIKDKVQKLPMLEEAVAIDKEGQGIDIDTKFMGGISVKDGVFIKEARPKSLDFVDIQSIIEIDSKHLEQSAEILVVAAYQPEVSYPAQVYFYMLDTEGNILPWDGNFVSLIAFQMVPKLDKTIEVSIFQGEPGITGIVNLYVGYRLENGTLVYSLDSLNLTIIK